MTGRAEAIAAVTQHLIQAELAKRWRVSSRTLERWRSAGKSHEA